MSFDVSQFRQSPLTAILTYKNIYKDIYLRRAALPQTGADPAIPQVDAPCSKVNTSSFHPIQEMMHNSSGRAWHAWRDCHSENALFSIVPSTLRNPSSNAVHPAKTTKDQMPRALLPSTLCRLPLDYRGSVLYPIKAWNQILGWQAQTITLPRVH